MNRKYAVHVRFMCGSTMALVGNKQAGEENTRLEDGPIFLMNKKEMKEKFVIPIDFQIRTRLLFLVQIFRSFQRFGVVM
jgi:hypothetical protein